MTTSWVDGAWETTARGRDVLADARLNRGVAFTDNERGALGLVGMLPPQVLTIDQQAERANGQLRSQADDLGRYVFLGLLRDRNEVLYHHLLTNNLAELLPIVYTPTVGEAIQHYSHEYRRPRGVFLSVDRPGDIEEALASAGLGPDDVDLLVATDGEAILGIGDWGVGGIDISLGKLAVYTAAGGIHPDRVIPVVLDVGTNRQSLLEDPLYLGNRHQRVSEDHYDAFVDAYVETAHRMFPNAMLHFEDIGASNARRVLDRWRHHVCAFNDDIQGTGAICLAAVLSALGVSGSKLADQRVVIFGAGTAGTGIADQLHEALVSDGLDPHEASRRLWSIGSHGLLVEGTPMRDFQRPYARPQADVEGWPATGSGISLLDVVRRVRPTILIGTSGQTGSFDEAVVRLMSEGAERPIILPLSNPTSLSEALPSDLLAWSKGRALVATGSPFPPVPYDRTVHVIGQANNALVFPGLGLGTIVAGATRITDGMLRAAAHAIAGRVESDNDGAPLLPMIEQLRETSVAVATAVAEAASSDGVATAAIASGQDAGRLEDVVRASMWAPVYRPIRPV